MDNVITAYVEERDGMMIVTIRYPDGVAPDEQSCERLLQALRQAVADLQRRKQLHYLSYTVHRSSRYGFYPYTLLLYHSSFH